MPVVYFRMTFNAQAYKICWTVIRLYPIFMMNVNILSIKRVVYYYSTFLTSKTFFRSICRTFTFPVFRISKYVNLQILTTVIVFISIGCFFQYFNKVRRIYAT